MVLGAGASVPYGFPTGRQLGDEIIKHAARKNDKIQRALVDAGYGATRLGELVEAFTESRQVSIDAFLGNRGDFVRVGSAAIAAVLIRCEIREKLRPDDREYDWIPYVWGKMSDGGVDAFEHNRLW